MMVVVVMMMMMMMMMASLWRCHGYMLYLMLNVLCLCSTLDMLNTSNIPNKFLPGLILMMWWYLTRLIMQPHRFGFQNWSLDFQLEGLPLDPGWPCRYQADGLHRRGVASGPLLGGWCWLDQFWLVVVVLVLVAILIQCVYTYIYHIFMMYRCIYIYIIHLWCIDAYIYIIYIWCIYAYIYIIYIYDVWMHKYIYMPCIKYFFMCSVYCTHLELDDLATLIFNRFHLIHLNCWQVSNSNHNDPMSFIKLSDPSPWPQSRQDISHNDSGLCEQPSSNKMV